MKHLPVHCCCDPRVVLGTMEVPDDLCYPGARIARPFLEKSSFVGVGDVSGTSLPWREGDQYAVLEVAPLWLEIDGRAEYVLAVKSNDMPIETFRKIPGFVENQHRRKDLEL